jgi:hypothetical protein
MARSIPIRFIEWLLHLLSNINVFTSVWLQVDALRENLDLTREVTIDTPMGISIFFVHDFCTRLSIALKPLVISEIGYQEVHGWITSQIQLGLGRSVALKQFVSSLLRTRQISGYFASFLATSFVPLHRVYSIFCEGESRKNWDVSVLRDDRSFFVTFDRTHTVNFLLKKALSFQVIAPTVGQSALLQVPLEALARCRHVAKLSHLTLCLHLDELDEFKSVVELFFKCRDLLVEIGFTSFRLADGELSASHPKGPGAIRVRAILKDVSALFEVDGEGDFARAIRQLLTHDFASPLVQIAVARFVISLFDCAPQFLAAVVQFFGAMARRTKQMGIDWAQSMSRTAVLAAQDRVEARIVAGSTTLLVEFTKMPEDQPPEIVAMDDTAVGVKFKTVKDLVKCLDSTRRS